MNYEEALAYIHNVEWYGKKPGLHRMLWLLDKIGNPHKDLKFVHVAGTNGKGSTCSMIASVLKEAGYKTGMFTSPYIHVFNERVQINGEMISNEDLVEIVTFVKGFIDEIEEKPTVFEIITLIGVEYFKRQKCDIVVLEVGIGGLLDSTNVIESKEAAVITSIGFDHTGMLGNSIEEIAAQKAGIIKENTDVVFWNRDDAAARVVEEVCETTNSRLYVPDYEALESISFDLTGQTFDYKMYKNLRIPLLGSYQLENAAVSLTALEVLKQKGYKIEEKHIYDGLSKAGWIGRFELLSKEPVIIVDGSHNPPGMKATAESLAKHFPGEKITFIMGIMADKELEQMLKYILPLAKEFLTVTPDNPRAMKAELLAEYLRKQTAFDKENVDEKEVFDEKVCNIKAESFESAEAACKEAVKRAGKSGIVCALGSLYLVDEITKAIQNCL